MNWSPPFEGPLCLPDKDVDRFYDAYQDFEAQLQRTIEEQCVATADVYCVHLPTSSDVATPPPCARAGVSSSACALGTCCPLTTAVRCTGAPCLKGGWWAVVGADGVGWVSRVWWETWDGAR